MYTYAVVWTKKCEDKVAVEATLPPSHPAPPPDSQQKQNHESPLDNVTLDNVMSTR